MAAAEFGHPSQALVRPQSGRLKTRSWAPGHGLRNGKHVGSDGMEVWPKSAMGTAAMAATVKRSGGRFLRDLVHFEAG